MKYLKLTNSEVLVSIDDDDYDRLMALNSNFYHKITNRGKGSIMTTRQFENRNNKMRQISLPRFILNVHTSMFPHVDHIDRNIYNNSKSNLRLVTHHENGLNKEFKKPNVFLGIFIDKRYNKWRGKVCKSGKQYSTTTFDNPEDAAKARDALAIQHHGDFATLNFTRNVNDIS